MAIGYNPSIVTNGLVLCLDAANIKSYPKTGNTWFDLSGNGNHATLYNSPVYTPTASGGLIFNGTSTYAEFDSTSLVSGNNPFTFESFYYINGAGNAEIFGNYGSGFTTNYLWISAKYGVFINSPAPYFPGNPLGAGTYHMAFSRTVGGLCTLYKNGVSVATTSNAASIANSQKFRVGSDVNGFNEPFTGYMYSIKLYNRVLTDTEILQNFNATRGRYGI